MLCMKYEGEMNGKKVTLEVYRDEYAENPRRAWENLGTMVCFHGRYDLGDKKVPHIDPDWFNSWDEMEAYLEKEEDAAVILPLYLYDHGGITISTTPFSCPWDSGQVGFIYVTREKILEEFGRKKLSKKLKEQAEAILLAEVEVYNDYLEGNVFGFRLKENDALIEECWGFYGDDIQKNGIMAHIPEEYLQAIAI